MYQFFGKGSSVGLLYNSKIYAKANNKKSKCKPNLKFQNKLHILMEIICLWMGNVTIFASGVF